MPDTRNIQHSAILLISCPDQRGLVAAISSFLNDNNGNIIDLEQHVDTEAGVFFMRVQWDMREFAIPALELADAIDKLAKTFNMRWDLHFSDDMPRMAVFVSRHSHCLLDIFSRIQSSEWNIQLPLVISNHSDLKPFADNLGIDFQVLPVTPDNKAQQEQEIQTLLKEYRIDFIVLARYMQILSEDFVRQFPNHIINIHHSFLPAFPGARPYHSAHARGVKIIGATSHYVTADLDAGPIIEQDVVRVTHNDAVQDLVHKGRDLEKLVLARAIWKHLQRKVLVHGNRTVVFE